MYVLQFCCFTPSTSVISVAQPIRVEISHKVDLNKQLFQVSIIDLEKKKVKVQVPKLKYKSQNFETCTLTLGLVL